MKKYIGLILVIIAVFLAYALLRNGDKQRGAEGSRQLRHTESTDWALFRGDARLSGFSPVDFSEEPETAWTYEAGAAVSATAAIIGDRVYIATKGGRVAALQLDDGMEIWSFDTEAPVSASPCVIGDIILIGDAYGIFYALDSGGNELWRYETGAEIRSSATPGPDGTVLFGSYDFFLYALDIETGELKWKFETKAQVHCSPTVADEQAIIAGCDGKIRLINAFTGEQVRAVQANTNFSAGTAWIDGYLYVGSMTGEILELDSRNGSLRKLPVEDVGPVYAQAAVTEEIVVFATRGRRVFALNREDGELKWKFRTRDRVDSSPVIAGRSVVVGSAEGRLYALDIEDGSLLWSFDAGAEINSSPAIGSGHLIIGTDDGAVYAFICAHLR